jgi:peptidoglycan hydrolase-like protein with peptidoglycan-binding domain
MGLGERGAAVAILQGALIDLGYKMPKSTTKANHPDGVFGEETREVVRQFQHDAKLEPRDGIAGHDTWARLDAPMSAGKTPKPSPGPPPPVVPPPIADRNYRLGVGDPTITPDFGSGAFNSEPKAISMWALKQAVLEILPPRGNSASIAIGMDAARHMKHYMDASGAALTIDLEDMIASGPTATAHFRHEVRQAQLFVEKLVVGSHVFTSLTAESSYNYKGESTNWYFAVGGYSTWGKGTANVLARPAGKEYEMRFEYRFYDRYNWDKGKSVTIGPVEITDKFMGEFHRQGYAREYDMVGSITRTFRWKHGDIIPEAQYQSGGWR